MSRLSSTSTSAVERLVSFAIMRAEALLDQGDPMASAAWREVAGAEVELASRGAADDLMAGIARVGAISAALSAGAYAWALSLAAEYKSDPMLPDERRQAIERALDDHEKLLASRFPALARSTSLRSVIRWKAAMSGRGDLVFPWAA